MCNNATSVKNLRTVAETLIYRVIYDVEDKGAREDNRAALKVLNTQRDRTAYRRTVALSYRRALIVVALWNSGNNPAFFFLRLMRRARYERI